MGRRAKAGRIENESDADVPGGHRRMIRIPDGKDFDR